MTTIDVLVDTSVWVDYFRGSSSLQARWLDAALSRMRVGIPDLALAELLQGARDTEVGQLEAHLSAVEVVSVAGEQIARKAAQNYRRLRRTGSTVRSTIDCLIATFAIENDLPLLHSDRDFTPFERHLRLRTPRWSDDPTLF